MSQSLDLEARRREIPPDGAPVESVGRAAAGGLLVAVALVELTLGFWSAGWQQRAVALTVACVGVAFIASGLTEIALAARRTSRGASKGSQPTDQTR